MNTDIKTKIHKYTYNFPFVPSNMDTVISKNMTDKIIKMGGMVIYHRFCDISERIEVMNKYPDIYMSVGISDAEKQSIDKLIENNVKNYCIDVAHGHSEQVGQVISYIKSKVPDASIIAGNVCSYDGYKFLVNCGAQIIKCGVGGGCLTHDTRISMADGTIKKISEVKVNDWVYNKDSKPVRVIKVMNMGPKRILKLINKSNYEIKMTYSHLVLCYNMKTKEQKWIEAYHIKQNKDFIPMGLQHNFLYNQYKPIFYEDIDIQEPNTYSETWDIEVECPTHSFIANDMIVHNSVCLTRMKTGFGVPQFSSILECVKAKNDLQELGIQSWLIADGAIKYPRDACIALGAGADMIMMGSLFAKTYESAGKKYIKVKNEMNNDKYEEVIFDEYNEKNHLIFNSNNKIYSHYRGQASDNFMTSYYGEKKNRVAEGVDFYVECLGGVKDIIDEFSGSLRSALTYNGSYTLTEFKNNVEFFESTSNFMAESNHRTEHKRL